MRPVDWCQTTIQPMTATAEIGPWMSQLFPNHMTEAFVSWEIRRRPQFLALLQEHPELKHVVRGWKELLSSGNLVSVLPGKVQKHDRLKALGLVELKGRLANETMDGDLHLVFAEVAQYAARDIEQVLEVLSLQREKVEIGWSPREQAQRLIFSSYVKDVTILAQAAELLKLQGTYCAKIEQAAGMMGSKTGNFCAVCEPILNIAAIGHMLRGKTQSDNHSEALWVPRRGTASWRCEAQWNLHRRGDTGSPQRLGRTLKGHDGP